MTSRPSLGVVPQRPPQRTLSGSGLSQRPATHQRSLSQQFLPSSPIRKETFPDFLSSSSDAAEVAQGRYGTTRRGGSRLKVELSSESITHDDITESPNAMDSSKPFTPSRIMPLTDASDLGEMSPHTSTQAQSLDADSGPLPMPKRRQRFAIHTLSRLASSHSAPTPKKDARPKPYSIETPSAAPQYRVIGSKSDSHSRSATGGTGGSSQPAVAFADFQPWTGNHPEDQFSEYVIRNGFFDKAPVSQTETASAKAGVFPNLKHKSGGNALSQVLLSVLAHRRYSGQINSTSTFKPPPRVTLTDTKREVWLKDLANPAISLRRLSRTIPHGIRGKVLLDQCLNKNIPADRAVWLAKCVGANEIRAFKRKGVNGAFVMGGETKWIRDWTVCVEQFVDSIITSVGDADWGTKVNYAIRLATHLFVEYLVDREHYMEWLVSGLENSSQARLPMWMMLNQIYLEPLMGIRKMGRRLVAALISHLHAIQTNPDKDLLSPLASRLSSLLGSLLRSNPSNFIHPTAWPKYIEVLRFSQLPTDDAVQLSLRLLGERNEQLSVSSTNSQPALRQVLIKHLDTTLHVPLPVDLPAECWSLTDDKAALGDVLLDWCTSIYRPGPLKVFVAARFFRVWSTLRFDVTLAIFAFLDSNVISEQGRRASIYHLVSELVRSGHFSTSRYFQWIIARGGLSRPDELEEDGPCATRLLVELPIDALTESQQNIRAGMLRRASFPVEEQAQDTGSAIRFLSDTLRAPYDPPTVMSTGKAVPMWKLAKRISRSSRALKTQIGSWLRNSLGLTPELNLDGAVGPEMSCSTFNSVRLILESCEDFTRLGETMALVTRVSNVEILASCTDTVNKHLLVFSALGVAEDLFHELLARLKAVVEVQGILARPLLASLASLAPRLPGLEELSSQLTRDLAQSDRNTGVDACSPVSDNMALRAEEDGGDVHEEIEKLLTSGTSLDRKTMDRLFETITTRLCSNWENATDRQRAYSALLTRLRVFDSKHFDSLMVGWVRNLRTDQERPSILGMFPVLISMGCLNMSVILTAVTTELAPVGAGLKPPLPPAAPSSLAFFQALQGSYRTRFMQEVLLLVLKSFTSNELMSVEDCYRFNIAQQQVVRDNTSDLLGLIRNALAEYTVCQSQNDLEHLPLDNAEVQSKLVQLFGTLTLQDTAAVVKTFASRAFQDPTVGAFVDRITTRLLLPNVDEATQVSFDQVLELTNDLTLPFCQLKLSLGLAASDSSSPDPSGRSQSRLELFISAIDNAIDARNIHWLGMLPYLGPEITHHLKNRAQSRFLGLVPSLRSPVPSDAADAEHNIRRAENLLSVIDTIVRGNSMSRPPQLVPAFVDKITDLWELLATPNSEDATASAKADVFGHWVPLMLSFVTLHVQNIDPSRAGNEVRARAALVLAGLMQELDTLGLTHEDSHGQQHQHPLAERIFDLVAVLTDTLSEETRLQCVRAVRDVSADPQLRYLFSFAPQPGEGLVLAHKERLGARNAAAAAAAAAAATATNAAASTGAGVANGAGGAGVTPTTVGAASAGEKLRPFTFRRWEILNEPTPNVGENDTSVNLVLFEARKIR